MSVAPVEQDSTATKDPDEQDIRDYLLNPLIGTAATSFLNVGISGGVASVSIGEWEDSVLPNDIFTVASHRRRKQKGSFTRPPQVSDSELQEANGLLQANREGNLDDLNDIRSKYPSGLQLDDLKRELEDFSRSSHLRWV
jgi:hypothetical protein